MTYTAADLTVVIPARDSDATVTESIASIQRQSVAAAPSHVIVVDDGSMDTTAETAAACGAQVVSQQPGGPGSARNCGVTHTTSALIAFCDADDTWEPGRIAADIAAFNTNNSLELILGRTRYSALDETLLDGHHFDRNDMTVVIPHFGAATMRRSVFDTYGMIDDALTNFEDYEFFYRVRDLGASMQTVDRIMQTRMLHRGSLSRQHPPSPRDLMVVMQRSIHRRRARAGALGTRPDTTERVSELGQDRGTQ